MCDDSLVVLLHVHLSFFKNLEKSGALFCLFFVVVVLFFLRNHLKILCSLNFSYAVEMTDML